MWGDGENYPQSGVDLPYLICLKYTRVWIHDGYSANKGNY